MRVGYLVVRLLQLLLTVAIGVTLNFLLPRLLPGGPLAGAVHRARLGLTRPLWEQYLGYWADLARLDLGLSLAHYPATVASIIAGALPWTLGLVTASTLIAFVLGTLLGAGAAWPTAPRAVRLLLPAVLLPASVPAYLLALVLVFFFVVQVPLFPPAGPFDPLRIPRVDLATALDILAHALLPGLTLLLAGAGAWALGMRGSLVSLLGEDYLLFAEATGLRPRRIFLRYGLRNALLPQVSDLGVALGSVVSGALVVEVVFGYPGLGWLLVRALVARDYAVVQGIALLLVVALALVAFVVDLAYFALDPRIRSRR